MRSGLATVGGHLRALGLGTVRAWWHCLPSLLTGLSLGWLGYKTLLVLAASISQREPWLAVMLTAAGFTSLLVGYLYALRALGLWLSIDDALLREEREADGGGTLLQEPLGRLVAVTLVPFLAIYAVFGRVQQTSADLITNEVVLRGIWSDGVLNTLNPRTRHQVVVVGLALVVSWVLRRVLDAAHERSGIRVLGILTALVETFFMLVLIFGGWRFTSTVRLWIGDRRVAEWVGDGLRDAAWLLSHLSVHLPDWISAVWHWVWGPAWHTLMAGLGEPLLWLALAALTFGSHVLSLAELWRATIQRAPRRLRGVHLPGAQRRGVVRALEELQSTFLGDIDDKWMPTVHSLRLVLAGGAGLLGMFCLLHALAGGIEPLVRHLVLAAVGPQDMSVWVPLSYPLDLVATLVGEPLRLSLLAVAYLRCLQMVHARAAGVSVPSETPAPDDAGPVAAAGLSAASRRSRLALSAARVRHGWRDGVVALLAVGLGGWMVQTYRAWDSGLVEREAPVGRPVAVGSAGQSLEVTAFGAGNRVLSSDYDQNPMLTSDVFLGVDVVARTPGDKHIDFANCVLRQGGQEVLAVVNSPVRFPATGYQADYGLVFERPRGGLVGAQVVCTPLEDISSTMARPVFDLGIDEGKAARLEASHFGMQTDVPPIPEALR